MSLKEKYTELPPRNLTSSAKLLFFMKYCFPVIRPSTLLFEASSVTVDALRAAISASNYDHGVR